MTFLSIMYMLFRFLVMQPRWDT